MTSSPSDGIFGQLQQSLASHVKELEEREAAVSRRENAVNAVLNDTSSSDIIRLNVGGRKDISVLRRTLTLVEDSMLAAKFSGKWDKQMIKDKDGNIFIDQDPDLFLIIISHLRDKGNQTDLDDTATSPVRNPALYRMVEYYGLTLDFFPFAVVPLTCRIDAAFTPPRTAPSVLGTIINSEDAFQTFYLGSCGHNRSIVEYEITVTRFTRLQIGWHGITGTPKLTTGVGTYASSVALDVTNGQYLNSATNTQIQIPVVDNDAVIRTRLDRVNKQCSFWIGGAEDAVGAAVIMYADQGHFPCISLTGSVRISDVKYTPTKTHTAPVQNERAGKRARTL